MAEECCARTMRRFEKPIEGGRRRVTEVCEHCRRQYITVFSSGGSIIRWNHIKPPKQQKETEPC